MFLIMKNLDVNLAVNNLLSRDDEGDDEGESCEAYMSGLSSDAIIMTGIMCRLNECVLLLNCCFVLRILRWVCCFCVNKSL